MAADDLTAELDLTAERNAVRDLRESAAFDDYASATADISILLTALRAAQRIAGEWEQDAAYAAARAERSLDAGEPPAASALLSGRAQAKKDCADELITTITRTLNRESRD